MTRVLRLLGLLALSGACGEDKPASPRNQCSVQSECAQGARCDMTLQQCIATKTETPYSIVLQAATLAAEAGEVARHTFPVFELGASNETANLSIPDGLSLTGMVAFVDDEGDDQGKTKAVKAQLVFVPVSNQPGLPLAAVTAGSRAQLNEQTENFSVTLTPNTSYNVAIYPLGPSSRQFPPLYAELDTFDRTDAEYLSFVYPTLETFSGRLHDEKETPQTGRWVRLIDAVTGEVVSSIGVVGEMGELKLRVNPGVLADQTFLFQINLDNDSAWATVLEADATHIDVAKDNAIIIPVIPRFVRFQGTVDKSSEVADLSSTDLTFVSEFPVPNVAGEVGGRDFCRATLPSMTKTLFKCRTTRQGTTDAEGRFSVALLPGDYSVFLSPTRDSQNVDRATTQETTAVIETQAADAPQQGQLYMLTTGSRYQGGVLSSDGRGLDNVLVRAVSLGLRGYLGEVASYNRTSEAVTRRSGAFELAVDVGFYDLVARPAASTGFPWVYVANRAIKVKNETTRITGFVLPTPLLLAGTVDRQGVPQASANVDAYALVPGLDQGQRAVLIGQTTTDAEGRYRLLLAGKVSTMDEVPQAGDAGSE